jgi:hypothetical protein
MVDWSRTPHKEKLCEDILLFTFFYAVLQFYSPFVITALYPEEEQLLLRDM